MTKKATNPSDAKELRRQAETKLGKSKLKKEPGSLTKADAQRLVHELQVHQVELELQNEELMQARVNVEALLHQFTDLYDFAPVGYLTLAHNSTILQANLTIARILGVERGKLIKRRFGLFVSSKSRPTFNAFLDKLSKKGGKNNCEVSLLKNGNDPFWARIEATCLNDGRGVRVVVVDITERKRAEEELRYLSVHDALTGLYNRGFFMEEMARLERGRNFPISVIMADVDGLKDINDRHGHAAGDVLLTRVAQVLTAAFRAEDVVARLGGDEFAVLLPATGAVEAKISLGRARQMIQKNNDAYAGKPIRISFGLSTAEKQFSLSNLLREADTVMYREKRKHNTS